ncbi:MAG: zf-HC2 domain-containing protein [Acidobacteriota bacterium]|nr:zf-HC2 domain-containing protein [Acidobacteriota bacterium]MDQ7087467.1 zf-HC2 domain-containing protein [Acidobacteriota bacterium]
MLDCRHVTTMMAQDEIEGAPWRTRLAVRIHLLLCRHCRQYSRQLAAISWAARRLAGRRSEDLDELQRRILDKL